MTNMKLLVEFIEGFQKSDIYASASAEKSPFRDDLARLLLLAKSVCKQEALQQSEVDDLEFAKSALVKNKTGSFHQGVVLYPGGCFMMATLTANLGQFRQDQLLQKELAVAGEFALSVGNIKKDSIIKDKGLGDQDFEISVPNAGKFSDMVTKLNTFEQGASKSLRDSLASQGHIREIQLRMAELKDAFAEAMVQKFEVKLKGLSDLLSDLGNGLLDDEKIGICSLELQKWLVLQPFPKFQLAKLMSKNDASEIEAHMASLNSLCKLLQGALPKVAAMAKDDTSNPSMFLNDVMTNLMSGLYNADVLEAVEMRAPVLKVSIQALKDMIVRKVSSCVSKAAGTFDVFLGALLETEICMSSIMKTDVIGNPTQESDEGMDWSGMYAGFVHFAQDATSKVEIQIKDGMKTMEIHLAFLCLGGALLQVAKLVFAISQLAEECQKKPVFTDIYKKEHAEKAKADTKLDGLLGFLPQFARVASAFATYSHIMSRVQAGIGYMDNINDFAKKLIDMFRSSLTVCVQEMYGELDNMKIVFKDLFQKVKATHDIMGIFKAEKVVESMVAPLFGDANVVLLVFLGGKAGPCCEGISSFAKAMQTLPKDDVLGGTLCSLVTSLLKDLAVFASAENSKVFPTDDVPITLSNVSWFQGSLTLCQVMSRPLTPGETRMGLVSRCLKLLDMKKMGCEVALKQKASQIQDGK